MEVWSRAPLTLKAYVFLSIAWSVASLALSGKWLVIHLAGLAPSALISFFLLRGVRWLWWYSAIADGYGVLVFDREPAGASGSTA